MKKDISRALFIIPSYSDKEIDKHTQNNVMPYGVLSLCSYIEHYLKDIKCKVLDFNTFKNYSESIEILRKTIKEFKPDMVCLSLMYNSCLVHLKPICKTIYSFDKEILIVAGGIMATNLPEECFNSTPLLNAICHAEGEIPLYDFLSSKDKYKTLKEHPSWILPEDFKAGKKAKPTFVQNLDEIPIINYSLVDMTAYTSRIKVKTGHHQ